MLMPTAADTKFCTARPANWTRWPIVTSGEYDCQLVFATNDAAVLNDRPCSTPGRPLENGRCPCTRCNP
jgi:hypothetical protein